MIYLCVICPNIRNYRILHDLLLEFEQFKESLFQQDWSFLIHYSELECFSNVFNHICLSNGKAIIFMRGGKQILFYTTIFCIKINCWIAVTNYLSCFLCDSFVLSTRAWSFFWIIFVLCIYCDHFRLYRSVLGYIYWMCVLRLYSS